MPNERGPSGYVGVGTPRGIDAQDGTMEGASGEDDARATSRGKNTPACLPLPSPPSLLPKRTLTDSFMDSTVARFEAKCTVGGAAMMSTRTMGKTGARVAGGTAALTPSGDTGNNAVEVEARERTAQAWIEAVSGRPCVAYGTKQFARNLMSGEILCALVNAIRPGTIPNVHQSQLGFEQMENVDYFLSACRRLGVPDHALVDTADVFEMRDTLRVVELVHALGSAVQVSCPQFGGPHLGPAADPSLVAAVPPANEDDNGGGGGGGDDDDDEDGAFGEFWRASARNGGASVDAQQDGDGSGGDMLTLNAQDLERPHTTRRGFTTTVGSITDLEPPATLSARARDMCPKEMVDSPRALVFNADPIGHPVRSPSLRAAWESGEGGGAAGGGGSNNNAPAGRPGAWGDSVHTGRRDQSTPLNLWATASRNPRRSPSPVGLWGSEPDAAAAAGGGGEGRAVSGVSPSSASGGHTISPAGHTLGAAREGGQQQAGSGDMDSEPPSCKGRGA